MSSFRRDPYGPKRRPTDKVRRSEPDAITKVKCPVCLGCGMVPPEVAVLAETALAMRKDES